MSLHDVIKAWITNDFVEFFKSSSIYGKNFECYLCIYKVKVKLTLDQATKAQRGCRGIAVLLL